MCADADDANDDDDVSRGQKVQSRCPDDMADSVKIFINISRASGLGSFRACSSGSNGCCGFIGVNMCRVVLRLQRRLR